MTTVQPPIEGVWLLPPLAFARFGGSETPMANFHWADNDYASRGTAETVIEPSWTFEVCDDGSLACTMPETLVFRDGGLWRPICPFFEVHARWSNGYEGPLTADQLEVAGLSLDNVSWMVDAGNRKAFHYTGNAADMVRATIELGGTDHDRTPLNGHGEAGHENPLVSPDRPVVLGHAQVIRPTEDFPVLRLRITPPGGLIYAPTNTADRDLSALVPALIDVDQFLEGIHLTLNPGADWASWTPPPDGDTRTNPGGLYAQTPSGGSLGFIDDSNDGHIMFTISGAGVQGGTLSASARYTCCPPDFQPDRRPFVSVADGLTDEQNREAVFDADYVTGANWEKTEAEIADLLQRVRETMEASNLDHQNLRSALANAGTAVPPVSGEPTPDMFPFPPQEPRPGHPLPLLEHGRAMHKRFLAYDVFKRRLAERPEILAKIRNPTDDPKPYDDLMPAVMRGSDGNPLVLTQREYQLLSAWLREVEKQ